MAGRIFTSTRAVLLAITVSWVGACRGSDGGPQVEDEDGLPHVQVVEVVDVALRPESHHLVLLEPHRRARLAPRVGGEIVGIDVQEQQEVAAGQRLIRFAETDARGGLLAARASVSRIEAQISDTRSQLRRVGQLQQKGVATERDVESLETELATLEAQLRESEAQRLRAHDRTEATELVAPFAGIVTRIDAELGEYAGPGTPIIVVSELDPLALELSLTEKEVALYDRGGLRFKATVRGDEVPVSLQWISREAEEGTSLFPTRLELANPQGRWRAGESAEVGIFGADEEPQPVVPTTAVRWSAGESYVFRVHEDTLERVQVTVGRDGPSGVVVTGGLGIGDRVVKTGPTNLAHGQRVVVIDVPGEQLARR